MAVEFDVVVDVDSRFCPLCILVSLIRQGLHGRFVDRFEEVFPRHLHLLQEPAVELLQLLLYRPVEIPDAEEGVIS